MTRLASISKRAPLLLPSQGLTLSSLLGDQVRLRKESQASFYDDEPPAEELRGRYSKNGPNNTPLL